jgi:Synaptobrevin
VDEVKNIMVENIERVLERGEKIELLVDKTDNLRFQASTRVLVVPVGMHAGWRLVQVIFYLLADCSAACPACCTGGQVPQDGAAVTESDVVAEFPDEDDHHRHHHPHRHHHLLRCMLLRRKLLEEGRLMLDMPAPTRPPTCPL